MFALKGWWTGNLSSFLTNSPSKYNVQALEDTTILKIGKDNKEQMFRQIPKMERFFRSILENALIAQQNRVIDFLSLSAEERYLILIEKFPGLEQKVSQKNIASYLGITPAFLCRLRKKRNK
jgi:CRP-like cAMP-binding protein